MKPKRKQVLARQLTQEVDSSFSESVTNYYAGLGWEGVNPIVNEYMRQVFGVADERYLSASVYRKLQKILNDPRMTRAYTDKAMYDVLVRTPRQPKLLVKRVNGFYLDTNNVGGSSVLELIDESLSLGVTYIIKPSKTANGKGVRAFRREVGELYIDNEAIVIGEVERYLDENYGNDFLIQEKVVQHMSVGQIHQSSVNTVRMLTFRWKDKIHYLQSFLRVGSGGRINDNAGTGGVCVGVEDDGRLKDYFVNESGEISSEHPTSGFNLKESSVKIENFSKYIDFVVTLHGDIPHHHLVSWDIAVGEDQLPVFIEHNFAGLMWLYQAATGKPIFKEMTDEVLRKLAPRAAAGARGGHP